MEFLTEIETMVIVETNKRSDWKKLIQQEEESVEEYAERVKQAIIKMAKI